LFFLDKLVSVYIPTHNRKGLVERAIRSVLNQTYGNIEIVVVDDCSSDGTFEYISFMFKSFSNVIILRNLEPKGACYSRNRAVENASGYFVTGLDDDDIFVNTRVESFIQAWDDNYSGLYSNVIINESGKLKKFSRYKVTTISKLIKSNCIGNQLFTTKDNFISVNGFDVNMPAWQDYELWLRFCLLIGPLKNTSCFDYIWDLSHEHERISSSFNRIEKAFQLIYVKHKDLYVGKHKKYLFYNMFCYPEFKVRPSNFLLVLNNAGFYLSFKLLIKKVLFIKN